ncbi:MAG: hypothetical protein AAGA39_04270 [Pseudomonadota bacterium]
MRIALLAVLSSLALVACASSMTAKGEHIDEDALTASGWRPAPLTSANAAVNTSAAAASSWRPAAPARPRPAMPAAPNFDRPAAPASAGAGFTGCTGELEEQDCFVDGQWVDALARFEPQSGRHWFLDPKSGNTYYADNGEFRTGDAFQEALRQGLISY